MNRRPWALLALVAFLGMLVLVAELVLSHPLVSLAAAGMLVGAGFCGIKGVERRGAGRALGLGVGATLLLCALGLMVFVGRPGEAALLLGLIALILAAIRRALRARASWPPAARPRHPVVVWNARAAHAASAVGHGPPVARVQRQEAPTAPDGCGCGGEGVSAAGMRSANVTANALRAGFHRTAHRAWPVPLGPARG